MRRVLARRPRLRRRIGVDVRSRPRLVRRPAPDRGATVRSSAAVTIVRGDRSPNGVASPAAPARDVGRGGSLDPTARAGRSRRGATSPRASGARSPVVPVVALVPRGSRVPKVPGGQSRSGETGSPALSTASTGPVVQNRSGETNRSPNGGASPAARAAAVVPRGSRAPTAIVRRGSRAPTANAARRRSIAAAIAPGDRSPSGETAAPRRSIVATTGLVGRSRNGATRPRANGGPSPVAAVAALVPRGSHVRTAIRLPGSRGRMAIAGRSRLAEVVIVPGVPNLAAADPADSAEARSRGRSVPRGAVDRVRRRRSTNGFPSRVASKQPLQRSHHASTADAVHVLQFVERRGDVLGHEHAVPLHARP